MCIVGSAPSSNVRGARSVITATVQCVQQVNVVHGGVSTAPVLLQREWSASVGRFRSVQWRLDCRMHMQPLVLPAAMYLAPFSTTKHGQLAYKIKVLRRVSRALHLTTDAAVHCVPKGMLLSDCQPRALERSRTQAPPYDWHKVFCAHSRPAA